MSLRAVIADYTLYNYWANKRPTQWLIEADREPNEAGITWMYKKGKFVFLKLKCYL